MNFRALEQSIEQACEAWGVVGAAVSIVVGDKTVFARGFGVRQTEFASPVDQDTLFPAGSTTKAFTTAAIGILVDQGKLQWDDAISKWLPTFCLKDPWLTRHASIRDAASHRTGFSHSPYPFLSVMSRKEAIRTLYDLHPEGAFRDSFVYSNLTYAVLGEVIEAASGMCWEQFVESQLLHPLAMTRSDLTPYRYWKPERVAPAFLGNAQRSASSIADALDDNVAIPHLRHADGQLRTLAWQSYDAAAPAGALITTASDMARWMSLYTQASPVRLQQLLSSETLQELIAPQNLRVPAPAAPLAREGSSYALGWYRTQFDGELCLLHGGGMLGSPAYVALLPKTGFGITVLANTSCGTGARFHKAIIFEALDLLSDVKSRGWIEKLRLEENAHEAETATALSVLQASRIKGSHPSCALAEYRGRYCQEGSGLSLFDIHEAPGGLKLRCLGAGAFSANLEHWHHDTFRVSSAVLEEALGPQFLSFDLDPRGVVTSVQAFGGTLSKVKHESFD